jgi:hypothetical protein
MKHPAISADDLSWIRISGATSRVERRVFRPEVPWAHARKVSTHGDDLTTPAPSCIRKQYHALRRLRRATRQRRLNLIRAIWQYKYHNRVRVGTAAWLTLLVAAFSTYVTSTQIINDSPSRHLHVVSINGRDTPIGGVLTIGRCVSALRVEGSIPPGHHAWIAIENRNTRESILVKEIGRENGKWDIGSNFNIGSTGEVGTGYSVTLLDVDERTHQALGGVQISIEDADLDTLQAGQDLDRMQWGYSRYPTGVKKVSEVDVIRAKGEQRGCAELAGSAG